MAKRVLDRVEEVGDGVHPEVRRLRALQADQATAVLEELGDLVPVPGEAAACDDGTAVVQTGPSQASRAIIIQRKAAEINCSNLKFVRKA